MYFCDNHPYGPALRMTKAPTQQHKGTKAHWSVTANRETPCICAREDFSHCIRRCWFTSVSRFITMCEIRMVMVCVGFFRMNPFRYECWWCGSIFFLMWKWEFTLSLSLTIRCIPVWLLSISCFMLSCSPCAFSSLALSL